MSHQRHARPYRKFLRTVLREIAHGFSQVGLSMSILPTDPNLYSRTDGSDWLEKLLAAGDWSARKAADTHIHPRKARHD